MLRVLKQYFDDLKMEIDQSHTSIGIENNLMVSLNTLISIAELNLDLRNFEPSLVCPLRFAYSMGAVIASHVPINKDYFYYPFTKAYFSNDGVLNLPEGLGSANLSLNRLNAEIVTSEVSVEIKISIRTPDNQSFKGGFLEHELQNLSDYHLNGEGLNRPLSFFPQSLDGLFSCLNLVVEINDLRRALPGEPEARLEFDKGLAYIVGNWLKEIG